MITNFSIFIAVSSSFSLQFRAREHPGSTTQPQQPAGDVGASAGRVRCQHRKIFCQLPTGRCRKRCSLCFPNRRRPGCGERESPHAHDISRDSIKVACNAFSIHSYHCLFCQSYHLMLIEIKLNVENDFNLELIV